MILAARLNCTMALSNGDAGPSPRNFVPLLLCCFFLEPLLVATLELLFAFRENDEGSSTSGRLGGQFLSAFPGLLPRNPCALTSLLTRGDNHAVYTFDSLGVPGTQRARVRGRGGLGRTLGFTLGFTLGRGATRGVARGVARGVTRGV